MKPVPVIICIATVAGIFLLARKPASPDVDTVRLRQRIADSLERAARMSSPSSTSGGAVQGDHTQDLSVPCRGEDVSVAVETYVKQHLKSPSTADFPWYSDEFLSRDGNRYTYVSYVDSQNGFGATTRTYFKAWVHCTGQSVVIDDIKFE